MIWQFTTYVKADSEKEAMEQFGGGRFIAKGIYLCKLDMTEQEILNMEGEDEASRNEEEHSGESSKTDDPKTVN